MNFNKKISAVIVFSVGFFILDRLLKQLFLGFLRTDSWEFLSGWFSLGFYKNYGIAFGLLLPQPLIICLSALILVFIAWLIIGILIKKELMLAVALIFILAGAVSNLWDRIVYGFVIDYFNFSGLTVFNLADCLISMGVLILLLNYLLCYNKEKID
jgi:signal peptidase II